MIDKCILYTTNDGGVAYITPSWVCFKALTHGGGLIRERTTFERQMEAFMQAGHRPDLARKWLHALGQGGLNDHEAFTLLRDKDMPRGASAPEVMPLQRLPKDGGFRDAWRRSHNGGPLWIDMETARRIHITHLGKAYVRLEKQHKEMTLYAQLEQRPPPILEFDMEALGARIHKAQTPCELLAIWPQGLERLQI